MGDVFDILWSRVVAPLHQGVAAGCEGEVNGGAGRGSEAEVLGDGKVVFFRVARGVDEAKQVALDLFIDEDFFLTQHASASVPRW